MVTPSLYMSLLPTGSWRVRLLSVPSHPNWFNVRYYLGGTWAYNHTTMHCQICEACWVAVVKPDEHAG